MKEVNIAIAGNPNAGKSTLFNALTGSHQHVGNWPGKTVEKKVGKFQFNGLEINVVDLPGTYSLSALSPEEIIARDYILNHKPDIVVTVMDAANLERNLYLAVQVLELGVPVLVMLNMADVAESRGFVIDDERLSQALGAPIIRTIANRGVGIQQLKETIAEFAENLN
ncbi:MAG: FeoB small GTPase domain-containing protein [Anaerolineales bacterium]|jgi:ferrous iron transport protein B